MTIAATFFLERVPPSASGARFRLHSERKPCRPIDAFIEVRVEDDGFVHFIIPAPEDLDHRHYRRLLGAVAREGKYARITWLPEPRYYDIELTNERPGLADRSVVVSGPDRTLDL